jgi:Transmembrane family 220, helix
MFSSSELRVKGSPVTFRHFSYFMAALFGFAVAVQYNDPDPLVWMLLYAAAAGVSLYVARRGTIPLVAVLALGGVALVWGLALAAGVPDLDVYRHMFDAWEMKSQPIEEAREASGLWIVAAWMALLAVRGRRLRRHE